MNVTLIDGTGTAARPGMTVLVDGDTITDVFATGERTLPDSAEVLDLSGRYVIPGLINTHLHLPMLGFSRDSVAKGPSLKASDRIEYGDIDDADDRAFFQAMSPITHVAGVRAPVLVLHGANDPRDPVTESDRYVRAIRENGGDVEYLRFPDEGHGIRRFENRIIAGRRIAAFLERLLGPAMSP